MTKKSGVWVDTKKALVVKLTEKDKTFKVIYSGIDGKDRSAGEGKKFGRFAKQFLSFEKRKQRKQSDLEKRYFKNILDEISGSEDLVLFGPSSTKHRLEKEIQSNSILKINLAGVEDADSMTDNQITAWVTDYFKDEQ
jgi:hypothetical protein